MITGKYPLTKVIVFSFIVVLAVPLSVSPASETELAAFRTVTSSLVAMSGKRPVVQQTSGFDVALKAADENLKSKKGEKYDTAFALKAAPWIAKALARCTNGLPPSELGPFTVLARVAESGKVEEVMVRPPTKVALCLKPSFEAAKGPKPPGPSWWVRVDISIK